MSVWRSRWAAVGAAAAVALGGGGVGLVGATASSGERPVTITVEPTRILDTRVDLGLTGRFANETPRDLQVTGEVPIAPSGTSTVVPAGAVAVLVNVTVVLPDSPGFLALRPGGASGDPTTSTVNWIAPGAIEPNAATVDLASDGSVQVYVKTAAPTGSAHVLVDIVGYTVDHTHDDRYYTESEVDSMIAGLGGDDYANVIVVAESGGHFDSVGAAVDAIGVDADYPAASESNRYLVWVAPGVYEGEKVTMKDWVDIEGAGRNVTKITAVGGSDGIKPESATLVGAANSELRSITVENVSSTPGNWAFALYTETQTAFTDVVAIASGGGYPRGVMVAFGAAPVLRDIVALSSGGTVGTTGIDVFQSDIVADGVFVDTTADTGNVHGLFLNTVGSARIENVTSFVSGGTGRAEGLYTFNSDVDLAEFDTRVTSDATNAAGILCFNGFGMLDVRDIEVYVEKSVDTGGARGISAENCDTRVRDGALDVGSGGLAYGFFHSNASTSLDRRLEVSDVEIDVRSTQGTVAGLFLSETATGALDTVGHVRNVRIEASGADAANASRGLYHSASGEMNYQGVSVDLSGQANFMYGVHAVAGTPRFHDLVVDARGEAQATVFGVEFLGTAGGSVDGARVRAENGSSGNDDAVGMKALNAGNVRFGNAVTSAEARGNAWGLDSVNSDLVLHDVDSAAVTTADGSWARGLVCSGGSLDADDLRAHASSDATAPTALFGTFVSGCGATIASSELVGTASAGSRYGLYVNASSGAPPYFVRDSYLAGESSSIRTLGYTDLHVVNSQLDGGATSSGSPNDQSTCTAVTHGSGTTFTFTAGPVSDCP